MIDLFGILGYTDSMNYNTTNYRRQRCGKQHAYCRECRPDVADKLVGQRNSLGAVRSPETRAKMSAAQMGNTKGRGNAGQACPPETRARISASLLVHGQSRGPTYQTWAALRRRCSSPSDKDYHNYGGRGITVCSRWESFVNFFADMGEKPEGLTIERVDNDGHYEPGNCRWATRKEQSANTRRTRSVEQ